MVKKISENQLISVLNTCYNKSLQGIGKSKSCYDLSKEYLDKYEDPKLCAKQFIKNQIAKCATSGFICNISGFIALPISLPANLTTVWYIQLRMIATIAIIGGYEPDDDNVQTLAYMCLTGTSVANASKGAFIKAGEKYTQNFINKKISGEALIKINKAIGYRFITKNGTTGIINLSKMIPAVGGIVGGGIDFIGTKMIADRAYQIFINGKMF